VKIKEIITEGVGIRTWKNQVTKDHGTNIKYKRLKTGGGVDDRTIATDHDGETVAVYNHNAQNGTVFSKKEVKGNKVYG